MILTRHAEALFWAGRYLERAEVTARWLEVASRFTMNLLPDDAEVEWRLLLKALGTPQASSEEDFSPQDLAAQLLSDPDIQGSVAGAVTALRDNLRAVRDRVPVELWEETNRLHLRLDASAAASTTTGALHQAFLTVREGCQAISGVLGEAMLRDEGHAFIVVGRMLERSTLTVRLLRASLERPSGPFDGDRILRCSSALQAYRRLYGHSADESSVTIYLLQTPDLPRSVRTCLVRVEARLRMVDPDGDRTRRSQRLAGRLRSSLEFGEFESEFEGGTPAILDELERGLHDLSTLLSHEVFRPQGELVLHSQFVRPGVKV